MAESGSEKRQRQARYTVRFSALEDGLIRAHAGAAGVPVATYLRSAALNTSPPRASRGPTADHELAALILGHLGRATSAFRDAAKLIEPKLAEEAARDMTEYRIILFQALGLKP